MEHYEDLVTNDTPIADHCTAAEWRHFVGNLKHMSKYQRDMLSDRFGLAHFRYPVQLATALSRRTWRTVITGIDTVAGAYAWR